ncbi:hypothetical protein TNCV_1716051 [Trichonephila clavipes]|nr:hypothetical protein TNCV_1716051 [Trichonephila clavipes]
MSKREGQDLRGKVLIVASGTIVVAKHAPLRLKQIDDHEWLSSSMEIVWEEIWTIWTMCKGFLANTFAA